MHMIIPYEQLKPETLKSIIEEFVTREGTEYGLEDVSLDTKVDQVIAQLKAGKAEINYDPKMQSCSISAKSG